MLPSPQASDVRPHTDAPLSVRVPPTMPTVAEPDVDAQLLQVVAVVPAVFGALEPVHTYVLP
jgi:hypothetical protein